ncbi:MAG: DUF4249 domain-containing protein [Bacteroidetes bacterium]|nr:DUF4249 domain-containing protein [Bacteroidota bacterium]
MGLVFMLFSCKEAYWPELDKYEDLLVVDGLITNSPGPYMVKLSLSSIVQNPEFIPYPNAQVIIADSEGTEEILTETEPGIYQTSINGIRGEVGKKYKIIITTPDEKIYESKYQVLKEPVGIEDVYVESEIIQTENDYEPLYGVQVYIDTELAPIDTSFFLWRLYGDYKYESDFVIRYIYDNDQLSVFSNSDSLKTCYIKDNITSLFTMSTQQLTTPEIKKLPLNFIDTRTRKLSIRYSLLVKQLSIDEKAYDFYSELQEMASDQEAIFTQQPYQLRGNVYNKSNPADVGLGYFLVAATAEKRIFIDRPDDLLFSYDICNINENNYKAFAEIGDTGPAEWPIYVTTDANGYGAVTNQGCVDCRQKGGTILKPEFWED